MVKSITALILLALMFVNSTLANEKPLSLVVLGDSLSAGYGLDAGLSFPAKLQKVLGERGHNVIVENAGVSGDTASGALSRVDWSVPDKTDMVIVELGANDALRGVAPEETGKALANILSRLKQKGASIILAGMIAPPNMGKTFGDAFNGLYPDLAQRFEIDLYPFFLEGVAAVPEFNQADGFRHYKSAEPL